MAFLCSPAVWLFGLFLLYKVIDRLLRRPRVGNYGGRYVFVTGCDSGFGRASAQRLDALGCHVFAGCLTEKGEDELKKTCSDRIRPIGLDVSKSDSVRRAFEYVKSKLPPGKGLWGLVNNAGVGGPRGRLEWTTLEDYRFVNSVNVYGLVDMTLTFLPLVKRERGRVVNTCSMGGRLAMPDGTPYTMSKFAAEAFSDVLRRSIAIYGCKVAIIEPGGFQTNINTSEIIAKTTAAAFRNSSKEIQEEFGDEYLNFSIHSSQNIKVDRNLDEVLDSYEDALFCRYPRARYVVGSQGRIATFITPLPEWLADWALDYFREGSKVLPAALIKNGRR